MTEGWRKLAAAASQEKNPEKLRLLIDELIQTLRQEQKQLRMDNKRYLRLRKAVLEREGYLVLTATTGSEALAIMRKQQVCLVLSDHMLSGTTGTALAEQLKAIQPTVPFVLYSGTLPNTQGKVDCFINKDEPVPRFLSIISSLIKRHSE